MTQPTEDNRPHCRICLDPRTRRPIALTRTTFRHEDGEIYSDFWRCHGCGFRREVAVPSEPASG